MSIGDNCPECGSESSMKAKGTVHLFGDNQGEPDSSHTIRAEIFVCESCQHIELKRLLGSGFSVLD